MKKLVMPTALGLLSGMVWAGAAAGALSSYQESSLPEHFERNFDWQINIDGMPDKSALLFRSTDPLAFLIGGPQFPQPVLLWPRSHQIEVLEAGQIEFREDTQPRLPPDHQKSETGSYAVVEGGAEFDLDDRHIRVVRLPPLLGDLTAEAIQAHDPLFRLRADAYQPDSNLLAQIRSFPRQATVTSYLKTLCSHCREEVPKVMRLERELAGSKVRFRYYGLRNKTRFDPQVPMEIQNEDGSLKNGLPTVVVSVEGKIVDTIFRSDLTKPEVKLSQILAQQQ